MKRLFIYISLLVLFLSAIVAAYGYSYGYAYGHRPRVHHMRVHRVVEDPQPIAPTKANKPKKIVITVDLTYQLRSNRGEFVQDQIQNELKTTSENRKWHNIQDKENPDVDSIDKDNLILLGKIIGANDEKIAMDFVVLSTNGTRPTIVTAPKIEIRFGQTGQILINENNQKLKFTVIATTT